jgi:hypothetical protein
MLGESLSMPGPRPVASLVRLGLAIGSVLVGAVLLFHVRYSPTIKSAAAVPVAQVRQPTAKVRSAPNINATTAPSSPNSATDFREAAKLMVPAPPQTEPALQGVDPRRLRTSFQRGMAEMQINYSDTTTNEGAGLVSMAAILGYEPARLKIVQEYPRSSVIRSAVSSAEAVRYSLDPLFISGAQSESNRFFLVLLASYFFGRHELPAYATDLLATLSDDQRLQTEDRLKSLLELLTRVPGACTALAHAVVKGRTVTGPECSPGLQLQIEKFISITAPIGLEAGSRRQALQLLENSNGS